MKERAAPTEKEQKTGEKKVSDTQLIAKFCVCSNFEMKVAVSKFDLVRKVDLEFVFRIW